MKRLIGFLIVLIFCIPVASWAQQDVSAPRVEITGANPADLPILTITANVYDAFNQPIRGLEAGSFALTGDLAGKAQITSVQNLVDNNLPFGVVLVVDVSSSMTGKPITLAKAAAQAFVDAVAANDPVAVYTFSNKFTLVQDFTSDKTALRNAIDAIEVGGTTGLYQAAANGIDLAASLSIPRRAIILLSDGAEYGGASKINREDSLEQAKARGVPIYTIGLGYGIDRSYLKQLSDTTNAQFFESPTPEQLATIYDALASLLRSQYVITAQADVPLDGTDYNFGVQVTTPEGASSATASIRTPIPIPVISLPDLSEPITERTKIEAKVKSDDAITQVELQIDGGEPQTEGGAPYTFNIEPLDLTPGEHQIDVKATDEQGDVGTLTAKVTIAELPPLVNLVSNFDKGPIENVQSAFLEIRSQTPVVSATYTIDGENPQVVTSGAEQYKYDVQPLFYEPGDHLLSVTVLAESGQSTTVEQPFSVATLPPYVVVTGLAEGQVVDAPLHFEVDTVASQSPVVDVTMTVNGEKLTNRNIAQNDIVLSTAEIDPRGLPPGTNTLAVTATNADGKTGSTPDVHFEVPVLPPVVVFENLAEGQQLEADLDAAISFIHQTPISLVTYFVDDQQVLRRVAAPWNLSLDVLALGPGPHTLRVVVQTSSGQESTGIIHFTVSSGPSLTATALVPTSTPTPSDTPTPTIDAPATATESARLEFARASATAIFEATIAGATQAAFDATATDAAIAATGTAYAGATGTSAAVAAAEARGTADARATSARQAELDTQATEVAHVTATAQAGATGTAEYRSTIVEQSHNIQSTATQQANQFGTATEAAAEQATSSADTAMTATENAAITATGEVRTTQAALAEQRAQATANAQSTQAVRATNVSAAQTETDEAKQTATTEATSTLAYRATIVQQSLNIRATATENANLFATATVEQATRDAEITAVALAATATRTAEFAVTSAAATATDAAQASATQRAADQATATDIAQATATENAAHDATATAAALATATENAAHDATATTAVQATATENAANDATATAAVQATATQDALEQATATTAAQATATENAANDATATAAAQATATQAALEQATATAAARITATQIARVTQAAQVEINARGTADAQATRDTVIVTQNARSTATTIALRAEATSTAERLITLEAQATLTQNAVATLEIQRAAIATQAFTDTPTPQQTAVAQAVSPVPSSTRLPPTLTPIGTLVSIEVQSQAGASASQLIPIIVIAAVVIILLLVIFLIIWRSRR